MKKILLSAALLAATTTAHAALPSLSDLANSLASLTTRFDDATNRVAVLTAQYAESTNRIASLTARIDALTNTTARFEAAVNSAENLRRAYHGGSPVSRFETNEVTRIIQRIDVYPDGWEYLAVGATRRALTPEEATNIAGRRRTAKTARIKFLEDQLPALDATGAMTCTNDTQILEAAKARLEAASIRRKLARLYAETSTNTVNVTITPQ